MTLGLSRDRPSRTCLRDCPTVSRSAQQARESPVLEHAPLRLARGAIKNCVLLVVDAVDRPAARRIVPLRARLTKPTVHEVHVLVALPAHSTLERTRSEER